MRFKTDSFAPVAHEGVNEGPVAGPDVENRARRQDLVQAIGERRAGTAEHLSPMPENRPDFGRYQSA